MINPLPFATYSFVMSITPGPNNIMLTASGAHFGFRRTLPHMLGICVGFASLMAAVSVGLGAVFARWPHVQTGLRWAGAAYLLYLGWKLLGASRVKSAEAPRPVTFWQAALFQYLNPKAWITCLTAATLFLPSDVSLPVGTAFMVLIQVLITPPCTAVWTLFGSSLRTFLARSAGRVVFNIVMATALAVTGVMMVV